MQEATLKQINLLNKLGVSFDKNINIKEASILISKTLKQQRQNQNDKTTDTEKTKATKQTIFTKDIFTEYKTLYYKKHYSYYNEKNFDREFQYVIKLENNFIVFDYPRIETRFCFGYGQNGISTQEEINLAYDEMHYADTNENYFLYENLKHINERINLLQDYIDNDYANKFVVIEKQWSSENTNEVFYEEVLKYDGRYRNRIHSFGGDDVTDRILKILTKDDIQYILNALLEIKEQFTKRLNAYLKKYGLSKLHTWTYLVD